MALLNKLLRSKETKSTDVGPACMGPSSQGAIQGASQSAGQASVQGSSIFKHSGVKSVILEFQVELDDVHRVRKPNQTIEGTVTLRLKRDVSSVWIRLSHVGECQLRSGTPKAMTSGSLRAKCSERLFCRSNDIYGSEQQPLDLTSGQHKFPFSCSIPTKNVLSSIDFKKGSVKYWVQAELHTRSAPVIIRKQWYQLVVPFDVSQLPKPEIKTVILQSPNSNYSHMNHSRKHLAAGSADHQDATSSLTKRTADSSTITNASTGSCTSSNSGNSCPAENISNGSSSGNNNNNNNSNNNNSSSNNNNNNNNKTVKISVEIPCLGYTVGEDIQVKVKVSHYKHYSHPAGLIATLVRICRVANSANLEQTETFRKDICQSVAPLYTDPDTHDASVMLKLKVPLDTFPTSDVKNKFFTFQYYVEVLANLSKKNQVYTESNRLVGGQRTSDIPTQSEKLSFIPKLITSDHNSAGEDESITFFQDLINVDRLKRLRNVTGMSIEIVLGTHREISQQQQQQQQESPVAEDLPLTQSITQGSANDNTVNTSLEEPSSPIDQLYGYLLQQNRSTLPEVAFSESEVAMSYPTDPVPSYNSNFNNFALPTIADDKQELEQMRLKELESEPSM